MIVAEKATWGRKRHASINLLAIHTYWITAKNDKGSQNQEIINRRSKILKNCRKADVSHAEREHQALMKFSLSTYNQRTNAS